MHFIRPHASMDYLWTPWRYRYLADPSKDEGCIFCRALELEDDSTSLIAFRGRLNFVILNRFPYTSGHVMIVPYRHTADLARCDPQTLAEMMQLAQRLQSALELLYSPDGYNLGMNLGRAAGAGVTGHLHLHVLPRWSGDNNFMGVLAETRVQPEDLSITYERLRTALSSGCAPEESS